jgi:hypothetical protein
MSCVIPNQELSNGYCYTKCIQNFSGYGAKCSQNCPTDFIDHGTLCEPPSILRRTTKPFISPCTPAQIERNGNCFEPQVTVFDVVNGMPSPKVTGCGCIRTTFQQRIKCPSGQQVYNTSCLLPCPTGYSAITDKNGVVSSMYCQKECPFSDLTKGIRWISIGNQCVKEAYSRLNTQQLPITTLSFLASQHQGSSLNSRNPAAARPYGSQSSGLGSAFNSWAPAQWEQDILFLTMIAAVLVFLFYAGPTLLPSLGSALGSLLKGVFGAAGSVVSGVGSAASKVIDATGELAADLEKGTGALTKSRLDLRAAQTEAAAVKLLHSQ